MIVVTEASKAVCGPKSRDRFNCAQTASRQLMPRFAGSSMEMGFRPWKWDSHGNTMGNVTWDGMGQHALHLPWDP